MGRTACTEPQCLYRCAFYLYLYFELLQLNLFSLNRIVCRISSYFLLYFKESANVSTELLYNPVNRTQVPNLITFNSSRLTL